MKSFLMLLSAILSIMVTSGIGLCRTYYIRSDGAAVNKSAATGPCSEVSACMSVSVHNEEDFRAGDVIIICDEGGTYRDQFEPPSSGSKGNPIKYQSKMGGSPTISAFDHIPNWSQVWDGASPRTNIYKAPLSKYPKVVLVRSKIGREETNKEKLDSLSEWLWEKRGGIGTLYVYGPDSPNDTQTIARKHAMLVTGREFLSFYGITFEGGWSPYGSVYFDNDCGNISIDHCSFRYAFSNGLRMNGAASGAKNSVTYSSFANNGNDGAYFVKNKNLIFAHNTAKGNGWGAKGDRQAAGFWNCSTVDFHHNTLVHSGAGDCLEFTGSDFNLVSGEIHDSTFVNQYGGSKQTVEIGRGAIMFHHNLVISHPSAIGVYTGDGASHKVSANIYENKVMNAQKSFAVYDDNSVHRETLIEIWGNISCNPALYHIQVNSKILAKTESDNNFFDDDAGRKFAVGRTGYKFAEWKSEFLKDRNSIINSKSLCTSSVAPTHEATRKGSRPQWKGTLKLRE